jgi:hypothetical protein
VGQVGRLARSEFGGFPRETANQGLWQVPFSDRDTLRYSAGMDINKMLAELREERDGIEQAILVLQRLSAGQGKRRGRPPAWMSAMKEGTKRRGRPPGSKNKQEDEAA